MTTAIVRVDVVTRETSLVPTGNTMITFHVCAGTAT